MAHVLALELFSVPRDHPNALFAQRKLYVFGTLTLMWCTALPACKNQNAAPKESASASAVASTTAPAKTEHPPKMSPGGQIGSFDQIRTDAKAKLETPPLTAPEGALSAPGGVRWQLVSNGHEPPIDGDDSLNADTTVWKADGTQAVSSFELPQVGAITLSSVGEQFRGLLQRLRPPAVARYWIPKQALQGWRPERWPDEDIIVQVNAYSVARSNEQQGAWGPKPASSDPPDDAKTSDNGYRYQELAPGSGAAIAVNKPITLVWRAWVVEGLAIRKLDRAPQQIQTTLEKVPGGLAPIVKTMKTGETRRIWVPKSQAGSIAPDAKGLDLIIDLLVQQ